MNTLQSCTVVMDPVKYYYMSDRPVVTNIVEFENPRDNKFVNLFMGLLYG